MTDQQRDFEPGIETDLEGRLTYGGYLHLAAVLGAQQPLSQPPVHDEMLFVVQHQIAELWMKLIIHEMTHAIARLRDNDINTCHQTFDRVKRVQEQLFGQWAVLETLTPVDYLGFRDALGPASGFQSVQYRCIEALMGHKDAQMLKLFAYDPPAQQRLRALHEAPSLYDEFWAYLARNGHAVPQTALARDWSQPYQASADLLPVLKRIYENTADFWPEFHLCEQLMDMEESFQLWRFRHMKTVERIIGHRPGTGGSSGVAFLRKSLELTFFPELFQVRGLLQH